MRKAALYGLVLVCVCILFALSGPSAQRIAPEPSAPVSRPAQVEVTNFPAVQQVAGTVSVGNLPVDENGDLRVSGGHVSVVVLANFVGVTAATFYSGQGTLVVSRACNAEMPNTRVCDWSELFSTIPPPQLAGPVILPTTLGGSSTASCITADGLQRCLSTDEPAPAACCSY
jgi:hypothetical protein